MFGNKLKLPHKLTVYVMTESNYEDSEYSVIGVFTSYEEALKFLNEFNTDHCVLNVNNGSTWIEMGVTYIAFEYFALNNVRPV